MKMDFKKLTDLTNNIEALFDQAVGVEKINAIKEKVVEQKDVLRDKDKRHELASNAVSTATQKIDETLNKTDVGGSAVELKDDIVSFGVSALESLKNIDVKEMAKKTFEQTLEAKKEGQDVRVVDIISTNLKLSETENVKNFLEQEISEHKDAIDFATIAKSKLDKVTKKENFTEVNVITELFFFLIGPGANKETEHSKVTSNFIFLLSKYLGHKIDDEDGIDDFAKQMHEKYESSMKKYNDKKIDQKKLDDELSEIKYIMRNKLMLSKEEKLNNITFDLLQNLRKLSDVTNSSNELISSKLKELDSSKGSN